VGSDAAVVFVEPVDLSPQKAWAPLGRAVARLYVVDPLRCPTAGSEMRIIVLITEQEVMIARILSHLRTQAAGARPPCARRQPRTRAHGSRH
jgi:hypothetical protein